MQLHYFLLDCITFVKSYFVEFLKNSQIGVAGVSITPGFGNILEQEPEKIALDEMP